ncbi:MAG: folylpolyglutamate synthase/dihydrofolate synthase family protein [Erythrobacter sp.]|jgi:dihydrofolate synthase/folylpolyglutamate synthase|nr:folylpolyglutamate synthase/dihydrofolate synthase family protein [Erythrobacter sp.]
MDFGRSDNIRVQAQLDRLAALSIPQGRFGLETITALMERLGYPHRRLPPVFHVAGTNGKGSVCAFLRAILEAEGKAVHVTTSPHLVRYNERIRLAGRLIEDDALADLLEEVLDEASGLGPSFFEVTIAAAFLAFSRVAADACVVEVGMGGRFDATNVLEAGVVAVSGIAALGLDHEQFLLRPERGTPKPPMARIAFEKAGIAKRGVPLLALDQVPEATSQIIVRAESVGTTLGLHGHDWSNKLERIDGEARHIYRDRMGELLLPLPSLKGPHQLRNAGLAVAMIRHQSRIQVSSEAIAAGLESAVWPGRMQLLADGPLTGGREVWIDGGHNASAGAALAKHWAKHWAQHWAQHRGEDKIHLILGMMSTKDPKAILEPLRRAAASITIVPLKDRDFHPPEAFGADIGAAPDLASAIAGLPPDGRKVVIAGSLYLVGEALELNGELPD